MEENAEVVYPKEGKGNITIKKMVLVNPKNNPDWILDYPPKVGEVIIIINVFFRVEDLSSDT